MNSETGTLGGMRDALIDRAAGDAEFRSRLPADPKAAVKEEFGFDAPEDLSIEVHEQTSKIVHLVLPPPDVLNETELKQVAGGLGCLSEFPPPSEW